MIIIGTVAGRGTFAVVSRHKMAGRGTFAVVSWHKMAGRGTFAVVSRCRRGRRKPQRPAAVKGRRQIPLFQRIPLFHKEYFGNGW